MLDKDTAGQASLQQITNRHALPQVVGGRPHHDTGSRIHGRGEPNKSTSNSLPEREAELELRRRLVDLVDDERVAGENVAILEPPPRDPCRHDDHVPRRGIGGGFPLSIHDADPQISRAQYLLGDRPDRERLARSSSGDDTESLAAARELTHARAVVSLEKRLDVEAQRELDRLARGARRRDDNDAS